MCFPCAICMFDGCMDLLFDGISFIDNITKDLVAKANAHIFSISLTLSISNSISFACWKYKNPEKKEKKRKAKKIRREKKPVTHIYIYCQKETEQNHQSTCHSDPIINITSKENVKYHSHSNGVYNNNSMSIKPVYPMAKECMKRNTKRTKRIHKKESN